MVRGYDRTRKGDQSTYCKNEYDNKNWMTIRICKSRNNTFKKHKQCSKFSWSRSIRDKQLTGDAKAGNTTTNNTIRYTIS